MLFLQNAYIAQSLQVCLIAFLFLTLQGGKSRILTAA